VDFRQFLPAFDLNFAARGTLHFLKFDARQRGFRNWLLLLRWSLLCSFLSLVVEDGTLNVWLVRVLSARRITNHEVATGTRSRING
jgi:uncharacterized membrane protein YjjP (DUF1212 family)